MHTTISIANNTSTDLVLILSSGVSPALASGWQVLSAAVAAHVGPVQVLTFDRGSAITNGDTWIFSTSTTFDGVALLLQEKVTGTLLDSTMAQNMTANATTTGFVDTNNTVTISAVGSSGINHAITWTLRVNSSLFCDIVYTIG